MKSLGVGLKYLLIGMHAADLGGSEALKGAPAAQEPLSLIINPALLSLSHNPQQRPGWGPQKMVCQHF